MCVGRMSVTNAAWQQKAKYVAWGSGITKYTDCKGEEKSQRSHGLHLQPRWNGTGAPPICSALPLKGAPALEVNHPFHCKVTPAILLGPRCNHDLGVLLRFPVLPSDVYNTLSSLQREELKSMWDDAAGAMVDTMIDHEFYCSDFASNYQPHIEGLMHTLVDSKISLENQMAQRQRDGLPPLEAFELCKLLMNRLISSTNRRMHKGFPEMLSYLLKEPLYYCSHTFVNLMFDDALRNLEKMVKAFARGVKSGSCGWTREVYPKGKRKYKHVNSIDDYIYRPTELESFPWYFFVAA